MVSKKDKTEMKDYLVAKLGEDNCILKSEEVLRGSGIESSVIDVFDEDSVREGVVLLVDRHYPNDSFPELYRLIISLKGRVIPVFYKDGKTFFRSAAAGQQRTGIKSKSFKLDELSLKNYTTQEMNKMISFRPEEIFVSRNLGQWVQYYQPDSERLEQGVKSYEFEPVVFDYSHIPSEKRFGPLRKESEKLSFWKKSFFSNSDLSINGRYLITRRVHTGTI